MAKIEIGSVSSVSSSVELGEGAFFYPFVTVDNSSKVLTTPPSEFERKIVVKHKVGDIDILVTDDGLIGIIGSERERAYRFLRIILATALYWNIQSQQPGINDYCKIRWEVGSDLLIIVSYKEPSLRNMISLQRGQSMQLIQELDRTLVSPDELRKLVDRAYEFLTKPESGDDLLLLAEAWSLMYEGKYNASFLYSWMLIEAFIDRVWDKHVESLTGWSSDDKDELKKGRNWTAYNRTEVFAMLGFMDTESRKVINKLRKKRNDIVHDRESVNQDDLKDCVIAAGRILYNQVHRPDQPFFDIERKRRQV